MIHTSFLASRTENPPRDPDQTVSVAQWVDLIPQALEPISSSWRPSPPADRAPPPPPLSISLSVTSPPPPPSLANCLAAVDLFSLSLMSSLGFWRWAAPPGRVWTPRDSKPAAAAASSKERMMPERGGVRERRGRHRRSVDATLQDPQNHLQIDVASVVVVLVCFVVVRISREVGLFSPPPPLHNLTTRRGHGILSSMYSCSVYVAHDR